MSNTRGIILTQYVTIPRNNIHNDVPILRNTIDDFCHTLSSNSTRMTKGFGAAPLKFWKATWNALIWKTKSFPRNPQMDSTLFGVGDVFGHHVANSPKNNHAFPVKTGAPIDPHNARVLGESWAQFLGSEAMLLAIFNFLKRALFNWVLLLLGVKKLRSIARG